MKKLPDAPFPPTLPRLGLYPVVDSVEWIRRLLDVGVTTLQLRIKDCNADTVASPIRQAIQLGQQYHARVFINDYWQLALEHGAYGVHLGQEDLDIADLPAIQQAGLRLGVSTHDKDELARAKLLRPSYIALGHIFPTQTKDMPSSPQGLAALQQQVTETPDYSTVAIGGISLEKVPAVVATGVGSVALVSAITQAQNWHAVTTKLLDLVEGSNASKEII